MLPEELKVKLHYLSKMKGFNIVQLLFQRSNKDRQCTRNVTLRHTRPTTTAVDNQYSKPVFVNLGIQHTTSMRNSVICGLSGSTVLFCII